MTDILARFQLRLSGRGKKLLVLNLKVKEMKSYPPNHPGLLQELGAMLEYRSIIEITVMDFNADRKSLKRNFRLNPAVVAGIGSRESRWGLALRPPGPAGTGDFAERRPKPPVRNGKLPQDGQGFGRGLMQLDYDWHVVPQWRDPARNIRYAVLGVLLSNVWVLSPLMDSRLLLPAVIASYNAGAGNVLKAVRKGMDPDSVTTHRDYSSDVLARAAWFQQAIPEWGGFGDAIV